MTSVLFGDLVGFTSLSESRDQEDVRELLSRYFDECRQIIKRYGGTVEKFIGDAVMAVWGVPTSHEDDAERAVRAGLELVNRVAALGEDIGVADLALRVGIVTGEVAVTLHAEGEGMVAGDPVNTASRVQSAAEPGQVWVDENTRLATAAAITYVDAGSHLLKGKVDPVPLWSVRAVVAAVGGAQREDGLEAGLAGRDRELRLVKELFHASEETKRPALLIVDSEPGVGKSRLGWEFFKYIDGLTTEIVWHSGRCLAYGEGVAFWAVAEAVRVRLGRADLSPNADLDERIDAGLALHVPDEAERDWIRPRIAALLGANSDASFAREDLFAAWATFFERAGHGDPVVLLIDDAQYADDGLLAFVEHLLLASSFGCMIILLTRPGLVERQPVLASNRRTTLIHLAPLEPTEMSRLIRGLIAGVPAEICDALVERADGVPLYAVETVRSMIDRDLVVPRGGQYVLADPTALDLGSLAAPASLQALVAARLDALSEHQRRVLNAAGVIGPTFTREQLLGLVDETADIDGVLDSLARLQMIRRDTGHLSSEFGSYRFVQTVVRQVAESTLSRRDRKALHLAVAAQHDEDNEATADQAPVAAQHYLDAISAVPGDPDVADLGLAAARLLSRAAARAQALGAPGEAAGHLSLALERVSEPAERARLLGELARAQCDAGRYDEAAVAGAQSVEAFALLGDDLAAAISAAAEGEALHRNGRSAEGVAIMAPRWEALQRRPEAAHALLTLGTPLSAAMAALGQENRDVVETTIQLAEALGDPSALCEAFIALADGYANRGAIALGRVLTEASADLARRHRLPAPLARALVNLMADTMQYDVHQVAEMGIEALEVGRRAGVLTLSSLAEGNLMLARWLNGDWAGLDDLLESAIAMPEDFNRVAMDAISVLLALARGEAEVGSVPERPSPDRQAHRSWIFFGDAVRAVAEGDLASGVSNARHAVEILYGFSGYYDDFVLMWPVAFEFARLTDDGEALNSLAELIAGGNAAGMRISVRAMAQHSRGVIAMRNADDASVEEPLRAAITLYAQWGTPLHEARVQADLGTWLQQVGRLEEAEPLLAAARATFEGLGATGWLQHALPLDSHSTGPGLG
ncbi:MAG: adenylate/guanylate cyclase domain-containing protein [Nocardioidaceae bacterium]